MQLEEYFDFFAIDDIRIKGTRIGIETVLYDFIHRSHAPEEIATTYPFIESGAGLCNHSLLLAQ